METIRDMAVQKIKNILGHRLTYEGDYVFSLNGASVIVPNDIEEYGNLEYIISEYINVHDDGKTEFLIKLDGSSVGSREIKFSDSKCSICVNDISNAMCIKILLSLPDKTFKFLLPTRVLQSVVAENNFYNLIRLIFRRYHSIVIEDLTEDQSLKHIEEIAKSSLFNISMCYELNFYLVGSVEDDDMGDRIIKIYNRSLPNVPHLIYNDDMVQYYKAGNSARIPKVQYLSYYNVLEFWFDKMHNDEKCLEIQKIVTNPRFNCSSLKSYKKIVDKMMKGKVSEIDLLQALVTKYVDVQDLKNFLGAHNYYIQNDAPKIYDTKISLMDSDASMMKKVTKRIYKVRNAIVHSKESEEEKYLPKEEKSLIYEVDLVKFVAEQVIIGSASVMN